MNPVDPTALEIALEAKTPTKKMALIRQLMPKIKQAIARGLTKKEVWESLRDSGMDLSYQMFITYLSRIKTQATALQPEHTRPEADAGKPEFDIHSTHAALGQAREHAAQTDYSKLIRNRSTRTKK